MSQAIVFTKLETFYRWADVQLDRGVITPTQWIELCAQAEEKIERAGSIRIRDRRLHANPDNLFCTSPPGQPTVPTP